MNLGMVPQYGGTVGGIRLHALHEAGGWHDDVLAEDTDLTYRLLLKDWNIRFFADRFREVMASFADSEDNFVQSSSARHSATTPTNATLLSGRATGHCCPLVSRAGKEKNQAQRAHHRPCVMGLRVCKAARLGHHPPTNQILAPSICTSCQANQTQQHKITETPPC